MSEHLNKQAFCDKVFNFEKTKSGNMKELFRRLWIFGRHGADPAAWSGRSLMNCPMNTRER